LKKAVFLARIWAKWCKTHFYLLLNARLFAAKRKTKWCKTQNKMQYFAIYERFLGVVDGINIRLLGLKCGF